MANIKINDLQPAEFAELSDLELEAIVAFLLAVIGLVSFFNQSKISKSRAN